jgi:hypothetical protein
MRQERADLRFFSRPAGRVVVGVIVLVGYFFLGAGVFHKLEGWSFGNGVYWAVTTLSTGARVAFCVRCADVCGQWAMATLHRAPTLARPCGFSMHS